MARGTQGTEGIIVGSETTAAGGPGASPPGQTSLIEALRLAAHRDRFRATLGDALRPLLDPDDVLAEATRVIATHLGASRVLYAEIMDGGVECVVARDHSPGAPSIGGERFRMSAFGAALAGELDAGRTVVVPDVAALADLDVSQQAGYAALQIAAHVSVPLVKDGRFVASLSVQQSEPRAWTAEEVALIEETAERTWAAVERARAESALAEREARFRALFSSIDEGYCLCEIVLDGNGEAVDYRFLEVNEQFEDATGLQDAVGRTAHEMIPDLEAYWVDTYARVALARETLRFEHESQVMGRWFDVYAAPVDPPGRFALVFRDVTERKRAEALVRDGAARDRFRAELVDAIRPLDDEAALTAEAMRLLGTHMGASRALYAELEPDGEHCVVERDFTQGVASAVGRYRLSDYAAATARKIRAGRTVVEPDVARSDEQTPAEKERLAALSIAAHIEVPLVKDGRLVSFVSVNQDVPRNWTPDDVALVAEVAERTWTALGRVRAEAALRESEERYRELAAREHKVAVGLQRALLPSAPLAHPRLAIAARYEAGTDLLEVGGDWYDTFALPGGRIGLTVGDVVGKGLTAAAAMGRLRTAIAALAIHAEHPRQVFTELDAFMAAQDGPAFASAWYGVLDPATGVLRYASAAHPPVVMAPPGGEVVWLEEGRSTPLRGGGDPRDDASETLEPGTLLVVYTDGLVERRGEDLDAGLARLEAAVRAGRALPIDELPDLILRRLRPPGGWSDDAVVMCLRLLPEV